METLKDKYKAKISGGKNADDAAKSFNEELKVLEVQYHRKEILEADDKIYKEHRMEEYMEKAEAIDRKYEAKFLEKNKNNE